MDRRKILALFTAYNLNREEHRWYRKVLRETKKGLGGLSPASCLEIQKRGGPDAIHLRPELYPPSTAMRALADTVIRGKITCNDPIHMAVLTLIDNDYPEYSEGIAACRKAENNHR